MLNSIQKIISQIISPTVTPINTVPERVVKFYLYQRGNINASKEIFIHNANAIDKTKQTKFVTHGYVNNIFLPDFLDIKNSYLEREDCNVILVDWSRLAFQSYVASADVTKGVGNRIGELIVNNQLDLNTIELAGHSLGSHVVGFAGKYVISATGHKVKRIIGMDPAGPSFEYASSSDSLAPTDAQGVFVFHTDAGVFGIRRSVGTLDFYFNGGIPLQPGCPFTNYVPNSPIINLYFNLICSHIRAVYLFNESINLNNFVGTACSSEADFKLGRCSGNQRAVLSESTPITTTGVYYLNTNAAYPYGQG